jgi:hypothetical protein
MAISSDYNKEVEEFREVEFPMLKGTDTNVQ